MPRAPQPRSQSETAAVTALQFGASPLLVTRRTEGGEETAFRINGTVSAKIAPRLKCYKTALRLNRYNFPTDNAIDFLFSILHSEMVYYEVLKIRSR